MKNKRIDHIGEPFCHFIASKESNRYVCNNDHLNHVQRIIFCLLWLLCSYDGSSVSVPSLCFVFSTSFFSMLVPLLLLLLLPPFIFLVIYFDYCISEHFFFALYFLLRFNLRANEKMMHEAKIKTKKKQTKLTRLDNQNIAMLENNQATQQSTLFVQ